MSWESQWKRFASIMSEKRFESQARIFCGEVLYDMFIDSRERRGDVYIPTINIAVSGCVLSEFGYH
jgi:hypothetical protein